MSSKTRQIGLIPKFEGPFEVIKKVGEVAYMLKLPERLKLHPKFHVSFFKPYVEYAEPGRVQVKRAPPLVMTQFNKGVEKILNHRTMGASRKNRRTNYLIQGKDSLESEATWDVTLWQFEGAVQDYLKAKSTWASTSAGVGGSVTPSDA